MSVKVLNKNTAYVIGDKSRKSGWEGKTFSQDPQLFPHANIIQQIERPHNVRQLPAWIAPTTKLPIASIDSHPAARGP